MNTKTSIELFYTLTCPNCKLMKQMLKDVLPQFGEKFLLKTTLANSPTGMIRTMKLGIHTVPTLMIDNKVVFKSVPTKEELMEKLISYQ
jgi:uroporphyrinogen decarboxylase